MTTYGVTPSGFVAPTVTDLLTEMGAAWRAVVGQSEDLDPQSPDGQLLGLMGDRLIDLWEGLQEVNTGMDPDAATGSALDGLCAVTGSIRKDATHSTVTGTLIGNAGTAIPSGSQASVVDTTIKFQTTADATLTALSERAPSTAYSVGALVWETTGGSDLVFCCVTAGTTSSGSFPGITDGSVLWRPISPTATGRAAATVAMAALDTGPLLAEAGTLSVIETPVSGWTGIGNVAAATPGRDRETDAELRLRREEELHTSGKSPLEALRTTVRNVSGVVNAIVFENQTDLTDGDGLPPHSFETVVQGGDDTDIASAIFAAKATGIATYGTTTVTVTDSATNTHAIKFSRATQVRIYAALTVIYDSTASPAVNETALKSAITSALVDYAGDQPMGKDVVANAYASVAFRTDPSVLDCTVLIGTSSPPVAATTIPISLRQLATLAGGDITISLTPGVP